MSKKVLKIEKNPEYDFHIAGIITGLRDYKLCFEINKCLELELTRLDDISLSAGRPGASTNHSFFEYNGPDGEMYLLLGNRDKGNTGFYIPEMKNVDYFFLISHPPPGFEIKRIISGVREIAKVAGVYEIIPETIKSVNNFLLLVED
jgi:hypothetical protein